LISKEAQLEFCTKCIHKKDHVRYGVICGLTNNYPVFSETCDDYSKSSKRTQSLVKEGNHPEFSVKTKAKTKSKSKTGSYLGKGILIYILFKIALKIAKYFME